MPSPILNILWALLFNASFATVVVLKNVTLDDANRNIVYSPSEGWWSVGFGPWDVDTTLLFDGTWHQALSKQGENVYPSVEVQFTGVAVYVYNVIYNPTSIQFQLDNESATIHRYAGGSGAQYNFLVYSNHGLENTSHTLTMALDNDGISEFFFDCLVVTVQHEEQNVESSSNGQLPINTTPSTSLTEGNPSSSDLSLSSSLARGSPPSPAPSRPVSQTSHLSLSSPVPPSQTQPTVALNRRAEIAIGGAVGGVVVTLLIIGVSTILCRRRARSIRERATRYRESFSPILEFLDASGAPEVPPTYTSLARTPAACPSKHRFVPGSPTSSVCPIPLTPSQPSAVYDGPSTDTPAEYETPSNHPSSVVLSPGSSRGSRSSSMPPTLPFAPDGQSVQQSPADPEFPEHDAVVHEDDGDDDMISTQVRERLTALELELQRLRLKQQEMHSVLHDAPPRYEET